MDRLHDSSNCTTKNKETITFALFFFTLGKQTLLDIAVDENRKQARNKLTANILRASKRPRICISFYMCVCKIKNSVHFHVTPTGRL